MATPKINHLGKYSLVMISKNRFGEYLVFPKISWTGAAGVGDRYSTLELAIAAAEEMLPHMQVGSRIVNNVDMEAEG